MWHAEGSCLPPSTHCLNWLLTLSCVGLLVLLAYHECSRFFLQLTVLHCEAKKCTLVRFAIT